MEYPILEKGQQVEVDEMFIAYITQGKGFANNEAVEDGDLLRGSSIKFVANGEVQLIVIHAE